ncbi:hypothetical protein B1F67_19495, partial [Pseudomonas syringae]
MTNVFISALVAGLWLASGANASDSSYTAQATEKEGKPLAGSAVTLQGPPDPRRG